MEQSQQSLSPTKSSTFRDNTQLSSYKDCPRKFQLRHVMNWRPAGTGTPLVFGSSWHAGQDALWKNAKEFSKQDLRHLAMLGFMSKWEEEGLPTSLSLEQVEQLGARTPPVAEEMYLNYIEQRWQILQGCELIAIEQPFAVPLPNIPDVWYVGRLDKVINYNGQRLIIEHKTTSEYKIDGGFRSLYLDSWDSDSQVKGYEFGGSLYFQTDQVWIDAALVHKKVHDKFRFVPVQHQQPIILEWIESTCDWVTRLNRDIERNYFPKNEGNCVGKYGACQFMDICRTQPAPAELKEAPYGYVVEPWSPFDTLGLDKLIQGDQHA